jgi:hypothetical protein
VLGGETPPPAEPGPAPVAPAPADQPEPAGAEQWAQIAEMDRELRTLRAQVAEHKPLSAETLREQLSSGAITFDDVLEAMGGQGDPSAPAAATEPQAAPAIEEHPQIKKMPEQLSAISEALGLQRVQSTFAQAGERWKALQSLDDAEAQRLVLNTQQALGQNATLEQAADAAESWLIDKLAPVVKSLQASGLEQFAGGRPEQPGSAGTAAPAATAPAAAAPSIGTPGGSSAPEPRKLTYAERKARAVARLEGKDPDA